MFIKRPCTKEQRNWVGATIVQHRDKRPCFLTQKIRDGHYLPTPCLHRQRVTGLFKYPQKRKLRFKEVPRLSYGDNSNRSQNWGIVHGFRKGEKMPLRTEGREWASGLLLRARGLCGSRAGGRKATVRMPSARTVHVRFQQHVRWAERET